MGFDLFQGLAVIDLFTAGWTFMVFKRRHFIRQPAKLATPSPADFLNLLAAASRTGCNFHRGFHLRLKRSLRRYEEIVDFLAYFFDQLTLSVDGKSS